MRARYTALLLILAAGSVSAVEITVPVVASLKEAFADIAAKYEKQYPQSKVKLNTTGSGVLLRRALQGAPANVLVSVDQETMNQAQVKDVIDRATRKSFALNSLVTAAPKDNKLTVGRLSDLEGCQFNRIAISNPASVPVGRHSEIALEKAGIWNNIRSKITITQNVRQSLDYIVRGEVDAGFIYNTDTMLMKDKVKVLKIVPTQESVSYLIAIVASDPQKAEAKYLMQYVLPAQGQGVLSKYGFKKP